MKRGRPRKKTVSNVKKRNVAGGSENRNSSIRKQQSKRGHRNESSAASLIDDSTFALTVDRSTSVIPTRNSSSALTVDCSTSVIPIRDSSSAIVIEVSSDDEIMEDFGTISTAGSYKDMNSIFNEPINDAGSPGFEITDSMEAASSYKVVSNVNTTSNESINDTGSVDLEITSEKVDSIEPALNIQKKRERRCFPIVSDQEFNDSSHTEESGSFFQRSQIYTSQINKYRKEKNKLVEGLKHLTNFLSDEELEPTKNKPVPVPTTITRLSPKKKSPPKSLAKPRKPKRTKVQKKLYSNLEKLISNYQEGQNVLDGSLSEDSPALCASSSPSKPQKTFLVTVKWKSKLIPCHLGSNEEFNSLLPKISSNLDVPAENIMFFLNEKLLDPFETPRDVNFIPGTFIECLVSSIKKPDGLPNAAESDDANMIEIKIQSNTERQKLSMKCNKHQPLQKVLEEYAALKNISPECLKLCFDGEAVDLGESPQELEIEDGDCLDVVIVQQ